jgi:hypothetical protein
MRSVFLLFFFTCFLSYGQTTYTPDAAVRKEVANALWEELKTKTPAIGLTVMERLIKSEELFRLYENLTSKYDMQPYEIGIIVGVVEDICAEISTGNIIRDGNSVENINKMKAYYKTNGIDEDLDNTAKQKKYDELILRAIWLGSINELEKKNSAVAKAMANELLETYSLAAISSVNKDATTVVQAPKAIPIPTKTVNNIDFNSNNLKDVVMITKTSYGLGGVYVSNKVYALFANGECLYEPSKPLETLDVAASKRENPKHWDTWEIKNNVFYLTDSQDGDVSDWKNWFKVRPAKNNFVLNGTFKTSDPFTGGTIINSSIVYFDAQGRFEWKTTKGGIGGWRPVLVNKNSSGTYKIENRTIKLNYGNGTTESLFFGLYPKDDIHFIIGSSHFVPVRK